MTATGGIDLTGLTAAPAQTWGAIQLVPLLRPDPITDLRLHARLYDTEDESVVAIGAQKAYVSLIPHAFVATWTTDATPVAAYGTQLREPAGADPEGMRLPFRRRMARREDRQRLRFLPLHLALEGYLTLQFGGPPIAWQEWTRHAVTRGLSPRVEASYAGAAVAGLDDALRLFEIHPSQCGVLLYVAGALAAAFVVPHPDDYRSLHPTLLKDLYGEQIFQYAAALPPDRGDHSVRLDDTRVTTLSGLRAQISQARADWAHEHAFRAAGLLAEEHLTFTPVQRMGRFALTRFLPPFDPTVENHIGEAITDDTGRLAYLKTFRLSAAQTRRGHLLSQLGKHDWNLGATAATLKTDRDGLIQRLNRAGFGHLVRPEHQRPEP
ncbi:hypothetical protein [Actinoplanes sp. M2I2]|uniref:ARPP-2 domain-containing protein n=1 Tax=Actinoplanes sp. M2I2 TaxID=1734444 RepID=UPI002020DECE|nr:hypothetical protein [Actinoplanes sp. M2I2]